MREVIINDDYLRDSDVDFSIGAVFIGIISAKETYDRWGDIDKTFYNIEAIKPLGYYDVDDADIESDT